MVVKPTSNIAFDSQKYLAKRIFSALSPFLNPYGCGEMVEYRKLNPQTNKQEWLKHPQPYLTKEDWDRYRKGQRGLCKHNPRMFHAGKLSIGKIEKAMRGNKIFGTGAQKGLMTFMVDHDDHEPWQTDSKMTVACLNDLYGNSLFDCPSDRGEHQFGKMDYTGHTSQEVNQLLRDLQKAQQEYCSFKGFNTTIEVKGQIAEQSFIEEGKHGLMAALPVKELCAEKRLSEFEALPIRSFAYWQSIVDTLREKTPPPSVEAKIAVKKARASGSFGLFASVSADDFRKLRQSYDSLATAAYVYRHDPAGRRKLIKEDLLDCFILHFLARKYLKGQNYQNELPHAWAKAVWQNLYERGIFKRPFDSSRWAAARNTMADMNMFDVVDNQYWFNVQEKDEVKVAGKCMQYQLADAYYHDLIIEEKEEGINSGTCLSVKIKFVKNLWRPRLVPAPTDWFNEEKTLKKLELIYCS